MDYNTEASEIVRMITLVEVHPQLFSFINQVCMWLCV